MKYLVALVFALFFQNAHAQSLWRDLPAGSTASQIRQKLPGASAPTKPSVLADGKTEALLEYTGFKLADLDFKAVLFFKEGKLDRIFLNPIDRPTGQAARVAAHKLRDSLKAKYGQPSNTHRPTGTSGSNDNAEWIVKGALIKFSFVQYSDEGTGFLQVLYLASPDTNNL